MMGLLGAKFVTVSKAQFVFAGSEVVNKLLENPAEKRQHLKKAREDL